MVLEQRTALPAAAVAAASRQAGRGGGGRRQRVNSPYSLRSMLAPCRKGGPGGLSRVVSQGVKPIAMTRAHAAVGMDGSLGDPVHVAPGTETMFT